MDDQHEARIPLPLPPERREQEAPEESDIEFIDRQFTSCIRALERAGAVEPGEFDRLANAPARTDYERHVRLTQHERIAVKAIDAIIAGNLREEDFNVWSGRRKEQGITVRTRFEEAYERLISLPLSHRRGTLTGIVRAFQRILDDRISILLDTGADAITPEELVSVERLAVEYGFLEFLRYSYDTIAGWPTFLRSTGKLRGAMRLRTYFEERQVQLPMTPAQADALLQELAVMAREGQRVGSLSLLTLPHCHTQDNNYASHLECHLLFPPRGEDRAPHRVPGRRGAGRALADRAAGGGAVGSEGVWAGRAGLSREDVRVGGRVVDGSRGDYRHPGQRHPGTGYCAVGGVEVY